MAEILVATDGSEPARRALAFAIELARDTGDSLAIVAVWEVPVPDFGFSLAGAFAGGEWEQFHSDYRAGAERIVAETALEARAAGIAAVGVTREGLPVREICAFASERGARLIVVGSHGWGAIARALLGSVSMGVVQHAPCPVLVVPSPHDEERPGRGTSSGPGD